MSKPRVIKDYDKLDLDIQNQIKLAYPYGFEKKLILFQSQGKLISALPFEAEDRYYLIRITKAEAQEIIEEDDDFDDDGNLKDEIVEELTELFESEEE